MKLKCSACKKVLKEPGALIFSPPIFIHKRKDSICVKYHICVDCWNKVFNEVK